MIDAIDPPENMDKILQRIRKCLALSASPEPHEAAAALRQAHKLMEKYGISVDDVKLSDVKESRVTAGRSARRPPSWLTGLASMVADSFGVHQHYLDEVISACGFVYVGVGPAPEIAGYVFTVLRRKLSSARENYYRKLRGNTASRVRRADAFAFGWVVAVERKVKDFAQPLPPIVEQYLQVKHPGLMKYKPTDRQVAKDGVHRYRGFLAGQDVDLHRGVDGVGPALIEHKT